MLRRFKIDELGLFFLLAITFLLLSFGRDLLIPADTRANGLLTYFDIANSVEKPEQGKIPSGATIAVYNPSVELLLSLDGGETFDSWPGCVSLDEINNPDITKFPTSLHWQQPRGEFSAVKSVVIKLKNHAKGAVSAPQVFTFFNEDISLPVISLTMPVSDLFSEAAGLMTFGEEAWSDDAFYEQWWSRPANFTMRGSAWEREVFFQYFENGDLQLEQSCGLKISGNATRGFPQKSMQLVARSTYGNDRFEFPFFGESEQKKYASLVIRNSGNDNTRTLFADLLMHRLAAGSRVVTQQGNPVVVYLNGNYWGVYDLRERIDKYFISRIADAKEEEVTILEGGNAVLKDGSEKVKSGFDSIMSLLNETAVVNNALLDQVAASIDLGSFTDYIVFETYFGNTDWPVNNSLWYKAGDDKWKFILNDLDYGLAYQGPDHVNINMFEKLENSGGVISTLFNKLMTNEKFKSGFRNRANEIIIQYLNDERVTAKFNELKDFYECEIDQQVRRWRMIGSADDWRTNCDENLSFLLNRKEIYTRQLDDL